MKKYICSMLIISFLFYSVSCTSFYQLNEDEKLDSYLSSGNDLLFILRDHSNVEANSGNYFFISEPEDFIYVIGDLTNKKTKRIEHFDGEIMREDIDSTQSVIIESQKYFIYWLKDSSRLAFEEGKFIDVVPEMGSGFWLIKDENKKPLFEKINSDDIKEIQVEKINYLTTSLLVLPFIVILVLAAVDAFPHADPPWGNNK